MRIGSHASHCWSTSWNGALRQAIVDKGYIWFALDNRGSAHRGVAFEQPIHRAMGGVEVRDQKVGAQYLKSLPFVDPDKIAIDGWSYGGYMTLKQLQADPGLYAAGISGAPVTKWELYDTHYTERYMGQPADNPQGYEAGSVMHHVDKMTGKLLLVHGLIDENVHFRHTARLINALIAARKPYDLLLFPDERHSPRRQGDRVYMEERVRDYFLENL